MESHFPVFIMSKSVMLEHSGVLSFKIGIGAFDITPIHRHSLQNFVYFLFLFGVLSFFKLPFEIPAVNI